MAIFIVLWSCLFTTKLRCVQKNKSGHSNIHTPYRNYQCLPYQEISETIQSSLEIELVKACILIEDDCHLDNFLGYLRIVNDRDIFGLTKIAPILRFNNTKPETFWKVEAFVVIFLNTSTCIQVDDCFYDF